MEHQTNTEQINETMKVIADVVQKNTETIDKLSQISQTLHVDSEELTETVGFLPKNNFSL